MCAPVCSCVCVSMCVWVRGELLSVYLCLFAFLVSVSFIIRSSSTLQQHAWNIFHHHLNSTVSHVSFGLSDWTRNIPKSTTFENTSAFFNPTSKNMGSLSFSPQIWPAPTISNYRKHAQYCSSLKTFRFEEFNFLAAQCRAKQGKNVRGHVSVFICPNPPVLIAEFSTAAWRTQ